MDIFGFTVENFVLQRRDIPPQIKIFITVIPVHFVSLNAIIPILMHLFICFV